MDDLELLFKVIQVIDLGTNRKRIAYMTSY